MTETRISKRVAELFIFHVASLLPTSIKWLAIIDLKEILITLMNVYVAGGSTPSLSIVAGRKPASDIKDLRPILTSLQKQVNSFPSLYLQIYTLVLFCL